MDSAADTSAYQPLQYEAGRAYTLADVEGAYNQLLRWDAEAFAERGHGRSGLVSPQVRDQRAFSYQLVERALDAGVTFERLSLTEARAVFQAKQVA